MLITFKRALAAPLVAAVVVLPLLSAHPAAARAATTHPAAHTAATQPAAHTAATQRAAHAATTQEAAAARKHHHRSRRMRAYIWAAHQRGKPYCWGGTGGCFDCSGLVMAAYRHEGLYFGRDTTDMLASGGLVRVRRRQARKGDLAFYGTGHVELVAGRRSTLGALEPGTRVGWHRRSRWWHPTMFFHVRDAG